LDFKPLGRLSPKGFELDKLLARRESYIMLLQMKFSRRAPGFEGLVRLGSALLFLMSLALPASAGEGASPARIIVAFQKMASPAEIQALERRYELKMISDLPAANSRVYLLTGSKNLAETLKAISAEPIARYAEIDQKVSIN